MNKYLQTAERGFTIVSAIFYTSGPLPLILSGGAGQGLSEEPIDPTDYSSLQILFFLNYFISCCLLGLRWKKASYALSKDWTIWLLMVIASISLLWSFTPALTRIRSIALVGTSIFGLYFASRYSIREQLKLLGWSFAAIIVMSFAFAILIPKFGIMTNGVHAGAWRGIYVHKNVLGKIMVIGTMVFSFLAFDAKLKHWFPWVGMALSFCLLILAKSSSSTINCVTLFALIPIYNTLRWRYHLMVPAIIAIVTIGGALSLWFNSNAGSLLGAIGKDPTLTGRTDMWPYIIDMIWKQPWLGYGYSAFWNDFDSPGGVVWYTVRWSPPNAHNGILDLFLELGLVGVMVFTIGFFTNVIRGIAWLRIDRSVESFWVLLYLTYLVLANVGESSLLSRNDIFWVLYVSLTFSLAIETSQIDRNAYQKST
jgi:exopolysaccharide production protein ExoQ